MGFVCFYLFIYQYLVVFMMLLKNEGRPVFFENHTDWIVSALLKSEKPESIAKIPLNFSQVSNNMNNILNKKTV